MVILGSDLTVQVATPAFCSAFAIHVQPTAESKLHDIGDAQSNIPELRRLLDEVIKGNSTFAGYRVDREFRLIGRRVPLVKVHRAHRECREPLIVLTIRDNTESEFAKQYSDNLADALRDPFLVPDRDLRPKTANGAFYNSFEGRPDETAGHPVYDWETGLEHPSLARAAGRYSAHGLGIR